MLRNLTRSRILIARVLIAVGLVVGSKLLVHWLSLEFISLNPLFSGIVAGNVFLMGFLLSGVLSDYKESERLPGEIAAALETIGDELFLLARTVPESPAGEGLAALTRWTGNLRSWFFKDHRTRELLDDLNGLTPRFSSLEQHIPANYIVRLKQEQANLRRIVTRIHTIRETSFVSSGYLVADGTSLLLGLGLVFAKIEPFREALFLVGVLTFLLAFLALLIRDLDNPFGYYEESSGEDVSLKPVNDVHDWLKRISG